MIYPVTAFGSVADFFSHSMYTHAPHAHPENLGSIYNLFKWLSLSSGRNSPQAVQKFQNVGHKSLGVRRSLCWVSFNTGTTQWRHVQIYFNGQHYKVWDSYGLSQYRFRAGSGSEDAQGRWYFNVVVETSAAANQSTG